MRRLPWLSIAFIVAIATVVYAVGVAYASARIADRTREALDLQQIRLGKTALRLEDYLGVAGQLSQVAVVTLGRDRLPADVERDLRRLKGASDRSLIDGIGVFYAPYSIDPKAARQGQYIETLDASHDAYQLVNDRSSYDYVWRPWYIAAQGAKGRLVFTGPYTSSHAKTFIGASQSFSRDGKPGGVVLIEALKPALDDMLTRTRSSDDFVWVTDADGAVIIRARAASMPSVDAVTTTPLRLAPWTLHVASYFPDVVRARTATLLVGVPATILYWIAVGALVLSTLRIRKLELRASALAETASRDALTGLRNRAYIADLLARGLHAFALDPSRSFGVLFVDLDRFAVVNDSLGHSAGDDLLRALARRIEEALPAGAEFGRIGGDEFVTFVPDGDSARCEAIAQNVIDHLNQPFALGEREIYISASIGIVICAQRYTTADELLRDADTAMYAAKRAGRGRSKLFDERMRDVVMARMALENDLRRALKHSELYAMYQPIVSLRTGSVVAVEALARWSDGSGRSVSPAVFIPLAEQTGTIEAVDTIVLSQACRDARALQEYAGGIAMSVNVSATRLNPELLKKLSTALDLAGLDARLLKVELTETAIMEHAADGLAVLEGIRGLGCQIVIDDFGTGHSSLSYVQRLPISGLKIDRSFITPIGHDRQSLAIVRAIVGLAKTLGLYVTAEGAEEEVQIEKLREMGVDYVQGFYYSPALDLEALKDFAAARIPA